MNRNNTSFILKNYEKLKAVKAEGFLQYHQQVVFNYVMENNIRGLLIYHNMGTGKTILGASLAVALNEKFPDRKIFFIASKALHNNFRNDLAKYLDGTSLPKRYIDEVNYITANASNMIRKLRQLVSDKYEPIEVDIDFSLDDTIVLFDEAHNFFNAISNESKNAMELYKLLKTARRISIFFLTGSPIINDPFEIALCFNMIGGSRGNKTLFGENYFNFHNYFTKGGGIIKKDKFQDRINGLVSYYEIDQSNSERFPLEYPMAKIMCRMSGEQFSKYLTKRNKEAMSTSSGPRGSTGFFNKPSSMSSSYRVGSRQVSNFYFADEEVEVDDTYFQNLAVNSPKLHQMLRRIAIHLPAGALKYYPSDERIILRMKKKNPKWKLGVGPALVYSQFIRYGIGTIAKALEWNNLTRINDVNDLHKEGYKYAMIYGEIDPDLRTHILKLFKSEDNKRGKIISILLISSAGAEGINTKNVRHLHIFEPYWHWARIAQVKARASRLDSHISLPLEERTVQPYIYLSDFPKFTDDEKPQGMEKNTTDIYLYDRAVYNFLQIQNFNNALKESSIDCLLHNDFDKCRVCRPTNKQLFFPDIDKDIHTDSNCLPYEEKKILLHPIEFNDITYYYSMNPNEVPWIKIYLYDYDLGGYTEMLPDHEHFDALIRVIEKNKK